MNFKRQTWILLSLLVAVLMLISSGCASNGEQQVVAADTRIKDIQDRGVLRVAAIVEAPWAMMDPETNEWMGVSVDMMEYIANELDVEIEYVETDWGRVVPDVIADKVDIAAPGLYATPARAMVVWFSKPYAELGQIFVVRADRDDLVIVDDLNNPDITVAVHPGSILVDVANLFLPNAQQKSVTTMGTSAFLAEVLAGRADTFGLDNIKGPAFRTAYPELKTVPEDLQDAVFKSPIAMAIQNNQPDFLHFINVCIENMKLSGALDRSYDEWLSSDFFLQ